MAAAAGDTLDCHFDCPNWVDFAKEPGDYVPRPSDVKWFASLQPHLRTPQHIIDEEERAVPGLGATPNVKQRTPARISVKDSVEAPTVTTKLQFNDDSSDDEITAMLRAHNQKVQAVRPEQRKPVKTTRFSSCAAMRPITQEAVDIPAKKYPPPTASLIQRPGKRFSFAPRQPVARPLTSRKVSKEQEDVPSSTSLDKLGCASPELLDPKSIDSEQCDSLPEELSTIDSESEVSASPVPQQELKCLENAKPLPASTGNKEKTLKPSKKVIHTSSKKTDSTISNPSKCVKTSSLATRPGTSNTRSHVTMKPSKPAPNRQSTVRAAPPSSTRPRKSCVQNAPLPKPGAKRKSFAPQGNTGASNSKNLRENKLSNKVSAVDTKKPSCPKIGGKKPLSQIQNASKKPSTFTSNVLAIINTKTPVRTNIKPTATKLHKPRYSVETPSPPRTCDDMDDDELDQVLREKLKEHNARVEAKMVSGNRIPGRSVKTGNRVSLHIGSPARPKIKPGKK